MKHHLIRDKVCRVDRLLYALYGIWHSTALIFQLGYTILLEVLQELG